MIMSPFVLVKSVPLIGPPNGGQIEADGDEQAGIGEGGSAGAGAQPAVAVDRCGAADARELPAGEAVVAALSSGRCCGIEAPQRRTAIASRVRGEVSAEGVAVGAGEVRRAGGRALWADAGSGALGKRGWAAGGWRNVAALDAGGRVVES
jgi:hypothetical protein